MVSALLAPHVDSQPPEWSSAAIAAGAILVTFVIIYLIQRIRRK